MIGNMKNCTGIIRRFGGKVQTMEAEGEWKKDGRGGENNSNRARREERGNFKIQMAPPRFHKGLREKGKTGDGPYPNHLGRD